MMPYEPWWHATVIFMFLCYPALPIAVAAHMDQKLILLLLYPLLVVVSTALTFVVGTTPSAMGFLMVCDWFACFCAYRSMRYAKADHPGLGFVVLGIGCTYFASRELFIVCVVVIFVSGLINYTRTGAYQKPKAGYDPYGILSRNRPLGKD